MAKKKSKKASHSKARRQTGAPTHDDRFGDSMEMAIVSKWDEATLARVADELAYWVQKGQGSVLLKKSLRVEGVKAQDVWRCHEAALQLLLQARGIEGRAGYAWLDDRVCIYQLSALRRGVVHKVYRDTLEIVDAHQARFEVRKPEDVTVAFVGDDVEFVVNQSADRRSTFVTVLDVTRPSTVKGVVKYTTSGAHMAFKFIQPARLAGYEVALPALPKQARGVDELYEVEVSLDLLYFNQYGSLRGRVLRSLGVSGELTSEIEVALSTIELPHTFSPAALEEANALPDHVTLSDMGRRVDLRDIDFVTIDGEDAKDFDDAVYAQAHGDGWRLLVAIADVSHYVTPTSSLDADAQARLTSVYFPRQVIPMLPEKLSNGLCSLNPLVDRLVMVCDAIIDAQGVTTAYQFYPAVIHSKARLTYTEVWQALSNKRTAAYRKLKPLYERLTTLYALYGALAKARQQRHAIDLEMPEPQAVIENNVLVGFTTREHNDAHRLIEECMLVANVCAADLIARHGALGLYRVHAPPNEMRLQGLRAQLEMLRVPFAQKALGAQGTAQMLSQLAKQTKDNPIVQEMILRTMSRACYQPVNIGHYGLQFERYTHFTSPIRRYPDLLVHRVIKAILCHDTYRPTVTTLVRAFWESHYVQMELKARATRDEDDVRRDAPDKGYTPWEQLGILSSAAERRADDATRLVMRQLVAQLMRPYLTARQPLAARITGTCSAGVFVVLEAMPVDGFIHISNLSSEFLVHEDDRGWYKKTPRGHARQPAFAVGDALQVRLIDIDEQARLCFANAQLSQRMRSDAFDF